jgi:hypothetical protein
MDGLSITKTNLGLETGLVIIKFQDFFRFADGSSSKRNDKAACKKKADLCRWIRKRSFHSTIQKMGFPLK